MSFGKWSSMSPNSYYLLNDLLLELSNVLHEILKDVM